MQAEPMGPAWMTNLIALRLERLPLGRLFVARRPTSIRSKDHRRMTVKGTEELHLDEYYTIEARVFIREYVRSGIIVDKYSGWRSVDANIDFP